MAIKGVPVSEPVLNNHGDTTGASTVPQPVSRTHPVSPPVGQYVGLIDSKSVDSFQGAFHLGPNHPDVPHATFQGPEWPGKDASTLQWLYTGVVWAGGYTVFTYTDFVHEWRNWDGSLWGILEPHRLLRTFITVGITISLTYVLPLIEAIVTLSERFYHFLVYSFRWSQDALERIRTSWNEFLVTMNKLRSRIA